MDLQKVIQTILDRAVEKGYECGCQAAVFIDGDLAVNAYSGYTDWSKTKRVDENTIFPIYSTGKAPSSTVLHRLVEKGIIQYDTYIGDIWPDFACNGKEAMQIWHVLSYRSGLFEIPPLERPELAADWECMVSSMAKMMPAYSPGAKQQYHPRTYGWLTGGIACHATGEHDYFKLFRQEVGIPANMDHFYYGADTQAEQNAATLVSALDGSNYGDWLIDMMNNPVYRHCCDPSACAMSNALSVAKHYAALDRGTLLSPETLDNATRSWRGEDDPFPLVRDRWDLFGLGYVLSGPRENVSEIFGHGGAGGSEGLLDRKRHYAIAITRNLFSSPEAKPEVFAAIGLKNRDWAVS